MNPEILELFCQSVSDIGLFSWWSVSDDGKFQVEFAGTQLWMPPLAPDGPPCGTIALRFEGDVQRCFLRRDQKIMPADWAAQLANDTIRPLRLTPQSMKLFYEAGSSEFLEEVHSHAEMGRPPGAEDLLGRPVRLIFWAGEVGLAVASRRIALVSHQGDLDWQLIPGMVSRWWSYWEDYWKVRETEQARAWDYACEATVPVAD
ncbi:MAG: hypothetical protein U0931_08430 [Vulcanimicrobiota bacterium]